MTRLVDVPNPQAPDGRCWQYGPEDTPFVMVHCGLPKGHEGPHAWQQYLDLWRANPEAYLAREREAMR